MMPNSIARLRVGEMQTVEAILRQESLSRRTDLFCAREPLPYTFNELDEWVLCYATTIHKSQGSEYPVVVIPISTQHYMMLKRNLIYTGITRGKRLVVLVGQKRALPWRSRGSRWNGAGRN
jgi:ATP-dependent exoDNAse (exonuclease V) alpha subunit